MEHLFCVYCLMNSKYTDSEAVTILNGNALCRRHFEEECEELGKKQ